MKGLRARAALLTLASFVLWTSWSLGRSSVHPFADLSRGTYTDHFSHLSAARLFWRVGPDIWRRTVRENTRELTPEELGRLPREVSESAGVLGAVRGWTSSSQHGPLYSTWLDVPRFYPPGDELLFTPAAWAVEHLDLGFAQSNRLLMVMLLFTAHLSLFFFVEDWLAQGRARGWLGWLGAAWTYGEIIHWTLEGFYDAVYLGPLVLALRALKKGRPLAALLFYAVAAFLHFRAYFYAPLALVALWHLGKARAWRQWTARGWIAFASAAGLGCASLGSFALCWNHLQRIAPRNAVYWGGSGGLHASPWAWAFALGAVMIALVFAGSGRSLDAAIVAWMTGMYLQLPAAYRWYDLVPLPWLSSGDPDGKFPPWRSALQLGYVAFVAVIICQARLGPLWLRALL